MLSWYFGQFEFQFYLSPVLAFAQYVRDQRASVLRQIVWPTNTHAQEADVLYSYNNILDVRSFLSGRP